MIPPLEILDLAKTGSVIAFTVLYIGVTMIASELFNFTSSGGGALEFKKSKATKQKVKAVTAPSDVEKGNKERILSDTSTSSETLGAAQDEEALQQISGSESIFTWEDVEYSVPYMGGQRKLLNKITGFAKPGVSK
jgi:ATP-binding cassette subfamily G (WHITE) protein 2 (SNQ2)